MTSSVNPIDSVSPYDLVLHCRDGVVLANKLILAAVSHYARALLEDCSQPITHMVTTNQDSVL